MSRARRRLQAIQNALTSSHQDAPPDDPDVHLLVIPNGKKVTLARLPSTTSPDTHILVDDVSLCVYGVSERTPPVALTINGVGTPHEHTATHVPRYPVFEISPSTNKSDGGEMTLEDTWTIIYALFARYHDRETIPILFSPHIPNHAEVCSYVLCSGLGRTAPTVHLDDDEEDPKISSTSAPQHPLFLLRSTFWQGAGTRGYHALGWLPPSPSVLPFPSVSSFTRTPLVITAHPLRPPKPRPGQVLYHRFCPTVGQVLTFTYFDLGDADTETARTGETSGHLAAFHRWHNDERVNKGWNEHGTLDQHTAYVKRVMRDPAVLPVMMSWDGELMGYVEIVWLKENHASTFVPNGVGDWDRGIHVLTGEEKFRGWERAQAWLRSLHHYIFLADPRTGRVFGEPKADNAAIIQVSLDATMHIETIFDFPYKRSVLTCMPRERFFKLDVL